MGSKGGSSWKLSNFSNLSEEMPSLAIVDTYQPLKSHPVSQQSDRIGSMVGNPWKLSDFSNLESVEMLLLAL